MRINVRINKSNKNSNVLRMQVNLEKDLKSCMRCKYFYGRNSQCIITKCVRETKKEKQVEIDEKHMCFQCPYKNNDVSYCFPCMKKILGSRKDKKQNEEMEERKNGFY